MAGTPLLAAADSLSARFPPLLVRAERLAMTVMQGQHGRRRSGPGEAFWQFRRYQPGDAVSTIDWRQTAKADHAFIREREWAAAETVALWCAGGPGMDWRSRPDLVSKRDRAALLGMAIACLLVQGGERIALLSPALPPASGRAALHRLAATLTQNTLEGDGAEGLPEGPPPRRGAAVLIGDWLMPLPEIAAFVQRLAATGVQGHLVHILDPAEEDLPYSGRVRFTVPGGSGDWLANRAEDLRPAFAERLAAHRAGLADIARAAGWSLASHRTDQPPELALLALYQRVAGDLRA